MCMTAELCSEIYAVNFIICDSLYQHDVVSHNTAEIKRYSAISLFHWHLLTINCAVAKMQQLSFFAQSSYNTLT